MAYPRSEDAATQPGLTTGHEAPQKTKSGVGLG
eukprot:CAMPEP_0115701100 /NCGR_PEP_ID=MMETSP0272-20121206/67772_1 /TAXON_ID=71861 /ORGANISM="Scrippsiella trochoidea, Strain CCMP3099" /LENGTH=32 /DNA_ID= /DNA_START= /DNA_END= /DNA_ORIENTATION=